MRRQFHLPEHDAQALDAAGHAWETILDGGSQWVVIRGRPVPVGYTVGAADVALMLTPGYPDAQIDMAYFYPALVPLDGRAIAALTPHNLDGRAWQRWSRHRTGANPWRPGEDDIASHLVLVDHWLLRALGRA
jgi:hypothetical protein